MDTIKCPGCGEEIADDYENCPVCGAPVGVIRQNSSVPVDNSSEIDNMLRSASMLIGESEALGLGAMEIPEEEEDEEVTPETFKKQSDTDDESGDFGTSAPDEASSFEIDPSAAAAEFTNEQREAINSGGVIELSPPTIPEKAPKKSLRAEKKQAKEEKKARYTAPTPPPEAEAPAPIEEEPPAPEPPKPPKPPKPKEEKKRGASAVTVLITAVCALIIGAVGGYFGKTMLFPDYETPECQEFALRAAKGVATALAGEKELCIAEAYVNNGTVTKQCVFKAFSEDENGAAQVNWYRIRNDADDERTLHIFFELDEESYEILKNSSDEEDQIQAAILKNNQLELERCISEIEEDRGGWEKADAALLNEELYSNK